MKLKDFIKQAEKIGSRNRCEVCIEGTEITDARLQFEDGEWFICQNVIGGIDCSDKLGYEYSFRVSFEIETGRVSYLRPFKKTLYNLDEGDIVVDEDGYLRFERMVLGVCGKAYVMSEINNFEKASVVWTAKELERHGYAVKGQDPEPETVEVLGKTYKKEDVEKQLGELEKVKEH